MKHDPRTPVPGIRNIADDYMMNRPSKQRLRYAVASTLPVYESVPVEHAKQVADYFDSAPADAPATPALAASYAQLCAELLAQWRAIEAAGIRMLPWLEDFQPYGTSYGLFQDLTEQRRMYFFLTEAGFGQEEIGSLPDHPLVSLSGVARLGTELLWNDILRAVHDVFGHAAEGNSFGPRGEYNAWLAHARMFSSECWLALACETKAQNFWVNFGPHLRRPDGTIPQQGEAGYVSPADRPFADQKLVELPLEWCNPYTRDFCPICGEDRAHPSQHVRHHC